ncbi:hypothetical protein TNCV_1331711 [Trichonephila clavipes]|nr:hypothetical protein TNCV_1331711 [Trichonephila clavipes]
MPSGSNTSTCLDIESIKDLMACTGTDAHAASTRCHSSSTIVTGVWCRERHSATLDPTFSIGERSRERAGQGNSRTFFVPRKVRTIPTTCDSVLSY